jgi:integrase
MSQESEPAERFGVFWRGRDVGRPGRSAAPPVATSPTNDDVRDRYTRHQELRGLAPGSIEKRTIALTALDRWLGGRSYFEMTGDDFAAFLDERDLADRSRYAWVSHVHCFFTWAIDEELAVVDPTAKITRPKLRRLVPRPIQTGDLADAIERADPMVRCWLHLAAYQGLCVREMARLDREDVLDTEGHLRVSHGKGGTAQRVIPLHPDVRDALRALPMPRAGAVFRRPMGARYTPKALSVAFNKALSDLGVDETPRQLRHWFGVHFLTSTGDLVAAQKMMGHRHPATTANYLTPDRPPPAGESPRR